MGIAALGFGLSAEQEERYRRATLAEDLTRARLIAGLVLVGTVGFVYNDLAFFGWTRELAALVVARSMVAGGTGLFLLAIARGHDHQRYDRLEFVWALAISLSLTGIALTRPRGYVGHAVVAVAGIFVTLLVMPNRFGHQVIVAASIGLGELVVLAVSGAPRGMITSVTVSIALVTAAAGIAARELHASRRREFLARDLLEGAQERLEATVDERTRALRRSSSYARNLIEASLDPLVTISPGGVITDVNRATEDATGLDRADLVGHDFAALFTDPEAARVGYEQALARGQVRDLALSIRHRSGDVRDVQYNATAYADEGGTIQGVFAAARDVTESRRLEAMMRQSQKLEAMGRLAGGVAHDFNNLLTVILGSSTELLEGAPAPDVLHQEAAEINAAARRAATLTRQLLVFSRREVVAPRLLNLSETVEGTSRMLARLLGETVELSTDLRPLPGAVLADPG